MNEMFTTKEDQMPEKERLQYPVAVILSGQHLYFDLTETEITAKLSDGIYMRKANYMHG